LREYLLKQLREIGESVNIELNMGDCCERSICMRSDRGPLRVKMTYGV